METLDSVPVLSSKTIADEFDKLHQFGSLSVMETQKDGRPAIDLDILPLEELRKLVAAYRDAVQETENKVHPELERIGQLASLLFQNKKFHPEEAFGGPTYFYLDSLFTENL